MVAEEFAKTGKSFDELEKEMLHGEKLQGTLTAKEVYEILNDAGKTAEYCFFMFRFPLFTNTYKIIYEKMPPSKIVGKWVLRKFI